MDRREFVITGSLAAAASSLRWLRGGGLVGPHTLAQASEAAATPASTGTFGALVRAMLPFDDPRFAALTPAQVEARADELFSIGKDADIQRNLALFDDLRQFAAPPAALADAEIALYPAEADEKNASPLAAVREAVDARAYQSASAHWQQSALSFTQLALADQRAYVMLWAHSALGVRRRFYRTMKTLVMAATYSADEAWAAIGYAGPLLRLRSS